MRESMDTYGSLLKMMRTFRDIGLREMARKMKMDSGNYSKLEKGIIPPPLTKKRVDKQLAAFELTEWQKKMFYDRAIIELSNHWDNLKAKRIERFWK